MNKAAKASSPLCTSFGAFGDLEHHFVRWPDYNAERCAYLLPLIWKNIFIMDFNALFTRIEATDIGERLSAFLSTDFRILTRLVTASFADYCGLCVCVAA